MAKLKELDCKQCGGRMKPKTVAKHSQIGAIFLLIVGLILCITGVGLIIGIPILLVGLFMGCGIKRFWVCAQCGTKIDKF